jgi:glycosyltransferase involved in cell wall biosynthesis
MIRQVAVIVPAADEEDRISACLQAINTARDRLLEADRAVERADVVVVLDACTDGTAAIVSRFSVADHVHAITTEARCVGAARQRGVLAAMSFDVPAECVWFANTDADSTVPSNWLIGMVAAANVGFEVVLGTVLPSAELSPPLRSAWTTSHRLTEGHPHVHGANLGIRGDTYRDVGGWNPDRAYDEDIDLAHRAAAASNIHILRTAAIPVVTSARISGRALNGFSSYMRRLQDDRFPRGGHRIDEFSDWQVNDRMGGSR